MNFRIFPVVFLSIQPAGAQPESAPPKDEFQYLHSKFDTDGFSQNKARTGGFDGAGNVFAEGALPPGRRLRVRSMGYGEIAFLRPKTEADSANFLSCAGQTIDVRTRNVFNVIFWLGASHGGPACSWVKLRFEDQSEARAPLGFSDWQGDPQLGEEIAFRIPLASTNGPPARIFLQRTPIPEAKRLAAITLPDLGRAKILAMTLAWRPRVQVRSRPPAPDAAGPGPVAIFSADRFPYYKSPIGLAPLEIRDALARAGIGASILELEHLLDGRTLQPETYPVFIHPYGKTFPSRAEAALRAYREAGGSMVHCGIPFTHPTVRTSYGGWIDLGKTLMYASHDPQGLGVGEYTNAAEAPLKAEDLLKSWGLGDAPWEKWTLRGEYFDPVNPQVYDPSKAAAGDELRPLVTIGGNPQQPWSAVVLHGTCSYKGCMDLWIGTGMLWLDGMPASKELRAQLVTRGAAWMLKEKGRLPDGAWQEISKPLRPRSWREEPAKLAPQPPGYLPSLPAGSPGSGSVYFSRLEGLAPSERVLLASAQGLLNRGGRDSLYLVRTPLEERAWLRSLGGEEPTEEPTRLSLKEVIARLDHRGCIVVDPDAYGSLNLATMVASVEGQLVAYPGDVGRFGLEPALDLRGLFASSAEMQRWAYENIWPRVDRSVLCIYPPRPEYCELRDYLVAHRIPILWIPSWNEGSAHAAYAGEEYDLVTRLLAETPAGAPVLGTFGDGSSHGLGETNGLTLLSRFGKSFAGLGKIANLSFRLEPPPTAKPPEVGPPRDLEIQDDKIYVAAVKLPSPPEASSARSAESPAAKSQIRGTVGHALDMASTSLLPRSADALESGGLPGFGGFGAVRFDVLGDAIAEGRDDALARYLRLCGRAMETAGMRFLSLELNQRLDPERGEPITRGLPPGAPFFIPYSDAINPPVHPLYANYTVGETPVFHDPGQTALKDLLTPANLKVISRVLPLFLCVGEESLPLFDSAEEVKSRVEFVRPDELADLYRKVQGRKTLLREVLIAKGSVWKYHDRGDEPASSWKLPEHDASAWPAGKAELGYGDDADGRPETTVISFGGDPQNRHVTAYFRHSFEIEAAKSYDLLLIEILYDDGCIVYLNGREHFRLNMPSGKVGSTTVASRTISRIRKEHLWETKALQPLLLDGRKNTLAVEVHQSSRTSSDLSFDLELTGYRWRERTE